MNDLPNEDEYPIYHSELALYRRAVELLGRFQYKPTVTLSVQPAGSGGGFMGDPAPLLRIQMKVPDSRRQGVRGATWGAATYVATSHNLYDDHDDHVRMRFTGSAADKLNPDGRPVADVVGTYPIPVRLLMSTSVTEEPFERWLYNTLVDLEIHEAREWFRRDGEIVDDPHNPTGRLA